MSKTLTRRLEAGTQYVLQSGDVRCIDVLSDRDVGSVTHLGGLLVSFAESEVQRWISFDEAFQRVILAQSQQLVDKFGCNPILTEVVGKIWLNYAEKVLETYSVRAEQQQQTLADADDDEEEEEGEEGGDVEDMQNSDEEADVADRRESREEDEESSSVEAEEDRILAPMGDDGVKVVQDDQPDSSANRQEHSSSSESSRSQNPARADASGDDDEDDEEDRDSEDDDTGEQNVEETTKRRTRSDKKVRAPRFVAMAPILPRQRKAASRTLAFVYLGCLWLREPILLIDLIKWARTGEIPFLAAWKLLPVSCESRALFRPEVRITPLASHRTAF
jgi:hypothetical protein